MLLFLFPKPSPNPIQNKWKNKTHVSLKKIRNTLKIFEYFHSKTNSTHTQTLAHTYILFHPPLSSIPLPYPYRTNAIKQKNRKKKTTKPSRLHQYPWPLSPLPLPPPPYHHRCRHPPPPPPQPPQPRLTRLSRPAKSVRPKTIWYKWYLRYFEFSFLPSLFYSLFYCFVYLNSPLFSIVCNVRHNCLA